MIDAIQQAKQALRKEALVRRETITHKIEKSRVVANQVISILKVENYTTAGLYMAMEDEVQTQEIIDCCWKQDIRVAVPKVEGGVIQFYWIEGYGDVREGHFKVLEPITKVIATNLDVLVIPMVAFDEGCNRLGYGKGYYDRYLSQYQGDQIGIAFEEQRFPSIPTDAYDQRLALIVSQKSTYLRK